MASTVLLDLLDHNVTLNYGLFIPDQRSWQ